MRLNEYEHHDVVATHCRLFILCNCICAENILTLVPMISVDIYTGHFHIIYYCTSVSVHMWPLFLSWSLYFYHLFFFGFIFIQTTLPYITIQESCAIPIVTLQVIESVSSDFVLLRILMGFAAMYNYSSEDIFY